MSSSYDARKILIESLPILALVLVLALLTGTLLDSQLNRIVPFFPFILLIIPAFINVSGDLAGVVGARVTSHLFTGELDKNFRPFKLLASNFLGVLLVAITAYAFLAVCVIGLSHFVLQSLSFQYILPFFFAILGAGVLATVCTSLLGLLGARIVYRYGRDPDSIIPPLTTTVGDLLGILFVTAALLLITL
jgi:cation transporter-like permease